MQLLFYTTSYHIVTVSNQSCLKCTKFLLEEVKIFVGTYENGFPYTSIRNVTDDGLRLILKDLKKQYPQLYKLKEKKK